MTQGKSRRHRGKRRRSRDCGTKVPYTESAARATARALSARTGAWLHAYKCPFCYLDSGRCAWHVGHVLSLGRRLG